jgi:hypothetical protein
MPARRDHRASRPAKQHATRERNLKGASTQESRPLHERIADIARDTSLRGGNSDHAIKKREIDDLWGNF